MTHTDLINELIRRYSYKTYLEIGVRNPAKNINLIHLPSESKVGVDPEVWGNNLTSSPEEMRAYVGLRDYGCIFHQTYSEYFWEYNDQVFDIIFIDGLHHASMVFWDAVNALGFINSNGMILIHDINPGSMEMQRLPRQTKEWTGNSWKAWCLIVDFLKCKYGDEQYPVYFSHVIKEDYGIGVIHSNYNGLDTIGSYEDFDNDREMYWDSYIHDTIGDFLG